MLRYKTEDNRLQCIIRNMNVLRHRDILDIRVKLTYPFGASGHCCFLGSIGTCLCFMISSTPIQKSCYFFILFVIVILFHGVNINCVQHNAWQNSSFITNLVLFRSLSVLLMECGYKLSKQNDFLYFSIDDIFYCNLKPLFQYCVM